MKFYYINNSLCEGCDNCSVACPSGAVYASGGKRYIFHDKCTSCGACIRTCAHNAVSIESIDAMVGRMENADLYLNRIRRLEQEVSGLNDRLDNAENNFHVLLDRYPSAALVCDGGGRIVISNPAFNHMAPGAHNIADVVPPEVVSMLLRGQYTEEIAGLTVELSGKTCSVQALKLGEGSLLCILDDLSRGAIAASRVSEMLDRAIARQMETVRKIGTILGDETSLVLNDINRALELLETADDTTADSENKR